MTSTRRIWRSVDSPSPFKTPLRMRSRNSCISRLLASTPHEDNDPRLWEMSQGIIPDLVRKYGNPSRQKVSRTRRVLIYDGLFVIKLPTSLEGIKACNDESDHFQGQTESSVVKVPPTENIGDRHYPIILMNYVSPLGEDAWQYEAAMVVDQGQLGKDPRTGEIFAFDL